MRTNVVVRIASSEEEWALRCIKVAAKKHSKLVNAKHYLRDQHGIMCDGQLLRHYNPNLK